MYLPEKLRVCQQVCNNDLEDIKRFVKSTDISCYLESSVNKKCVIQERSLPVLERPALLSDNTENYWATLCWISKLENWFLRDNVYYITFSLMSHVYKCDDKRL